jgi:hypothetical protein
LEATLWGNALQSVVGASRQETLELTYHQIVDFIFESKVPPGFFGLETALRSLGEQLAPPAAERATQRLLDLYRPATIPGEWSVLEVWVRVLPGLAQNLPREAAEEAADRILGFMEGAQAGFDRTDLLRSLGALGPRLGDRAAERVRAVVFRAMRPMPEPPCDAAAPLMRRGNLDSYVELLKWPTCSGEARRVILRRLGEVAGEPFGSGNREGDEDGGSDDLRELQQLTWDFVDWTATAGHDLESPPEAP